MWIIWDNPHLVCPQIVQKSCVQFFSHFFSSFLNPPYKIEYWNYKKKAGIWTPDFWTIWGQIITIWEKLCIFFYYKRMNHSEKELPVHCLLLFLFSDPPNPGSSVRSKPCSNFSIGIRTETFFANSILFFSFFFQISKFLHFHTSWGL